MKNNINIFRYTTLFLLSIVAAVCITGCEEIELPEANSIPDEDPPEADFSFASDPTDFRLINFTNLSTEAIAFSWDFGGGNTSTEEDPSFTFEAGEGTYPVTLTATDGLGVSNSITKDVEVTEGPFQPIIREPGFEDNDFGAGDCGTGLDGRDCWRNNDLGGVIQITGSPVVSGDQGAKLTGSAGDQRIGYQEVIVEAETNYNVSFIYTMLSSPVGYLTVDILDVNANGGTFESQADAANHVIGSITVNNQDDPSTYEAASVSFNSGTSTLIAIYFHNEGSVESRLDDFAISIAAAGAIPPSPAFSYEQSDMNFLEYTFTNNSVNATSYSWDFGDGNTSTEESPMHVYAMADMYTVTLTASNDNGLSADFSTVVDIQAPVTADFTYQVDAVDYRTYSFMDASVGAEMLLWEFGDGFQFTGMNPSHTYDADGIYEVKLTATSITGLEHSKTETITVAQGFVVQVLNGTFDEFTANTGDNADAWDMTPNSTVVDNDGNTIDSPYRPLWNNTDLNAYIDVTYGTNEQPATTSDGTYNGATKTRGAKFSSSSRRLYQRVQVEAGTEYTFSIDTRSEAMGVNTEVFILNTEITTEIGIDASKSDAAIDAYFEITNDFNSSKGDASTNTFTKTTFTFTPSANHIVIYVRSLNAVDSSNEVFLDNVEITEN